MADVLTPDICVLGAGAGGLSVAAAAAAFRVPVVLVEKGRMGGDCLNYGCVPSKALLAAAHHAHAFRLNGFGVAAREPEVDFAEVRDHIRKVIDVIAPNDSRERFRALGVQVIEGEARFRDADTVAVGDVAIKARRFVIATGSSPAIPPIPGLAGAPYLTNETIFELAEKPGHLIVIGAGPIGLEIAQAYRRLGVKVTVLEALRPLARDDPECAAVVIAQLMREGVDIRPGVKVAKIETAGAANGAVRLLLETAKGEETLEGTHLLIAAGRKPNLDSLDLEAARIKYDRERVLVDQRLRTTNKRVYAIGDVIGEAQFTHVANYHAGLVIRNALFRLPVRVNSDVLSWVTFTDPELAHVGLTEDKARERGQHVRVLRWPFHENDRAQAERLPRGHIKVITNARGRILGATIVGRNAGELITPWTLAVSQHLKIRAMAELVVPYPTLSEVGKRAATTYFTPQLTSPLVQRAIKWMRWFG